MTTTRVTPRRFGLVRIIMGARRIGRLHMIMGARLIGRLHIIMFAFAAILVLGGCTSGDDDGGDAASDFAEGGATGGSAADAPGGQQGGADEGVDGAVPRGGSAVLVGPTYEIKQGRIELENDDVAASVDKLYALAARMNGEVASEQTRTDPEGELTRSTVLLLVPVDTFDEAMQEIPRYGTLRTRSLSSEDVSAEVADVDTRVENARESVTQLRALFRRATRLGDVVLLESEIRTRQSDLESLLAQQRVLAEQTSMSEITVTVSRPEADPTPAEPEDEDRAGFLAGLKAGWDAMVAFVLTIGHALGAALPISLLLLAAYLVARPVLRRVRPTWWRPTPSE